MGQALYRDYRPKSFDDVVGQDHIVTTLKNAIKSGRISHAYLFTGPKGVGKTSIARILAHAVSGLEYGDSAAQLDIIEIDAASNNGIEDVRELREKVHVSPSRAKYKVYIIDEVHMLSKPAFNALLKTLEEPPAHAIFILATTESHKLPETIISRTQRFEFKPIGPNYAIEHLASIAKREKIDIDKPALALLAEHGEGSFRDSISLLDQLSTGKGKITEQDVREFLGLPPASLIADLLNAIGSGDVSNSLARLDELKAQGANAELIAKSLAKEARSGLIGGKHDTWATNLLRDLIEVPASHRPDDSLEIAILSACAQAAPQEPRTVAQPAAAPAQVSEPVTVTEEPLKEEEPKAKKPAKQATPKVAAEPIPFDDKAWEEIVGKVKDQAASLYTALRLATPELNEGKLTLAFQFPLHQKKVSQAAHKELIGQIVAQVTGQNLAIDSVVDKSKKPKPATETKKAEKKVVIKPADESVGTISNIFGAAEVIES